MSAQTEERDRVKKETKIAPYLSSKHPLMSKWKLWYFHSSKDKSWLDNMHEVSVFDTIEDFWRIMQYLRPCSEISVGCDYWIFKDDIRPMWEDIKNKDGGRWLCTVDRQLRVAVLSNLWLHAVMTMVGGLFDPYNQVISGIVIQIRNKLDKLAVWTQDGTNTQANTSIGEKLREVVNTVSHPSTKLPLNYELHVDSSTKSGSTARSILSA